MPRSRRHVWLRDELLLALDLYLRKGVNADRSSVEALSNTLRGMPTEAHLAKEPRFRSPASVKRKLANFLALETGGAHGLSHGGRGDSQVWDSFANDPVGLRREVERIRETYG